MSDDTAGWSEAESETFRDLSRYAVPELERQISIVVDLVSAAEAEGDVLDLCCGEGRLSEALLTAVSDANVLAYDGSDSMLAATRERVGATRCLVTRRIDLGASAWREFDRPLRAVVSSLAIHHLEDAAKRCLFYDLFAALAGGGVFVLADVIRPATAIGHEIAARLWDEEVSRQALVLDGTLDGYERFRRAGWNHFREKEPDPIDKPSSVTEHLDWLRAAGFGRVDLHWMTAGQMIVSGWKSR